jgi:phosphate transport system permease protein
VTTVAPARSESTGDSLTAARSSFANGFFSRLTGGAASLILVTLAAVATFLLVRAWPAITSSSADLASKVDWLGTASSDTLIATIGYLVFGTLLVGAMALLIGAPISFGIALFISHYAPRRLASTLGYIVDLLAAVPSVIYGLWGGFVLVPKLAPFYGWLNREFGWFPLFSGAASPTGRVALSASIVLAIMILPIITAVTREVFLQTPTLLAMGATRWEMIRMAVFPFARSGMIGATMLGLGRALGETMAVYMILSPGLTYSFHVLEASSHNTIAANIALKFPEANATGVEALIAMGLALFVITLGVNVLARWIVSRRSEFSGAN